MNSGRAMASVAAAVLLAPVGLAAAQAALPVYVADAALFLHRDLALTADAPDGADDAVFTFTPTTLAVRFESPALQQPWALRGEAALRTTFARTIDAQGRVSAILDLAGEPLATSTTHDLLLDFRPREFLFEFTGLEGTLPVGSVLGLTVQVEPIVEVAPSPDGAAITLATLAVDMLYDSATHPSSLDFLGIEDPDGPGASRSAGPKGPAGTAPGTPGSGANGTAGPGGTGGPGGGLPEPLAALGTGAVDPFLVMAGIGTSIVVVLGGLALRGRQGLG